MFKRIGDRLELTRYVALVGVLASAVLAAILFCVSLLRAIILIGSIPAALFSEKAVKALAVACVELADLTLLAAALFLVAVGLFEIFIADISLPARLTVTSLDDLKSKLVNVVAVILGVTFLGQVVTWDGVRNLLTYGLAIAAVIAALGVFSALRFGDSAHSTRDDATNTRARDTSTPPVRHNPHEVYSADPTDDHRLQVKPLQNILSASQSA